MSTLRKIARVAAAFGAVATVAFAAPSARAEYLVGLTGDLSGPASGTYKPLAEGVRVYFDRLNDAGGINGQKVRLITRDNRSDPNQVVTDLNFFDSQRVVATVMVSPSGTLGAYVRQNASLKIPTIYVNACYPPATPPRPDPNFFCPGISTLAEALLAVESMKQLMGNEKIKLAFVTTDIPGARGAAEKIMKPHAEKLGIEVADVAVMPVTSTDASAIARSFIDRGVNAVITYTISSHMLAGAEALTRLNWKGRYLMAMSLPGVYQQMSELASENIYSWDQFSLISEGKPVHKEMAAAAAKHGFGFPLVDMRMGYHGGMTLAEALRQCGATCSRTALQAVLSNLKADGQAMVDLNLNPVVFTPTNHTSPSKVFRVYRWSKDKKDMETVLDNLLIEERDWQ